MGQHSYCKRVPRQVVTSEPEPEPESESESKSEAEAEAEPESERSEPRPEPEPEPENESEAEAEPEAEALPEPEPDSDLCIPIGNCGAYGWCDQDGYVTWCKSEGQASRCPSVFCKIEPNLAQLRQRHHRSPRLRAHRTLGTALFQHSSALDKTANDDVN